MQGVALDASRDSGCKPAKPVARALIRVETATSKMTQPRRTSAFGGWSLAESRPRRAHARVFEQSQLTVGPGEDLAQPGTVQLRVGIRQEPQRAPPGPPC